MNQADTDKQVRRMARIIHDALCTKALKMEYMLSGLLGTSIQGSFADVARTVLAEFLPVAEVSPRYRMAQFQNTDGKHRFSLDPYAVVSATELTALSGKSFYTRISVRYSEREWATIDTDMPYADVMEEIRRATCNEPYVASTTESTATTSTER